MPRDEQATAIKIAKIAAIQAIIVAIITTVGGLLGYTIEKKHSSPQDMVQRWISIKSIEGDHRRLVRLVVSINGIYYTFPQKAVWAEMGENMAVKYPLPIEKDKYMVSFWASLTSPGIPSDEEAETNTPSEIKLSKVPTEKVCKLFPITNGKVGADSNLKIHYEIR
jgi:hypothetical protein